MTSALTTGNSSASITGLGEVVLPAGSGRPADVLAIESALAACDDAGIDPHDVDGIVRYAHDGSISAMALAVGLGCNELRLAADIPHAGGSAGAMLDLAAMAVRTGSAKAVLCTRTVIAQSWLSQLLSPDALRPFYLDAVNYLRPAGWTGYLSLFGLLYQEHAIRYGTTRESLAAVGTQLRANAAKSGAVAHVVDYTLEEYLAAPMTVSPFTAYDEFALADLSCAVLVTNGERARSGHNVQIVASAVAQGPDPTSWFDTRPLSRSALDTPSRAVADELYRRAGLSPADIDVAEIYDCTTFTLLLLLEEARLCERGGAAKLLSEPGALGALGARPTNTHGGDLCGGYSHGFRHVLEAVRQLRGTAANQVPDAQHALVLGPPAGPTSGAVLRRGD